MRKGVFDLGLEDDALRAELPREQQHRVQLAVLQRYARRELLTNFAFGIG